MSYPKSIDDLHRYAPVEGEDIRVADFNSLQEEIATIEAVLGTKIAGAAASLTARLSTCMNPNGTWKKEASCEDGAGGIGSRRYLSAIGRFNGTSPNAKVANALPAGLFPDAPIVLSASNNNANIASQYAARGTFVVTDLTPAGVEFLFVDQNLGAGSNLLMRALVLSTLQVFRDDVPFGAPPWRGNGVLKVNYT